MQIFNGTYYWVQLVENYDKLPTFQFNYDVV